MQDADAKTRIVFTPKGLAAFIVALLVGVGAAAGTGTFVAGRSEASVPQASGERLAIVETKLELLTQRVEETNRLVRGLSHDRALR